MAADRFVSALNANDEVRQEHLIVELHQRLDEATQLWSRLGKVRYFRGRYQATAQAFRQALEGPIVSENSAIAGADKIRESAFSGTVRVV